jgi:hypothetical protein
MIAFLVVLAFLPAATGCSTWQGVIPGPDESSAADQLMGKHVRVYVGEAMYDFVVAEMEYPYIRGLSDATQTPVEIDLRKVTRLEMREVSGGSSAAAVVVVVLACVALFALFAEAMNNTEPDVTVTNR